MPIKILLINAINPSSEIQCRFPNLGLGYLASSLLREFPPGTFEIKIVDRDVECELIEWEPAVVGITAVSQNYGFMCAYAKTAKERGIPVIVGGPHVSALPHSITDNMGAVVIGEGEEAFPSIIRIFLETGKIDGIIRTSLIEPLDKIQPPARHLLKIGKYAGIFSSRGCPFHCVFCSSSAYWQKPRFFSAEYVYDEIKTLVRDYAVRRISFYDDIMIADLQRLDRLAGLISQDNELKKIKFRVNARANLINEHTAWMMSKMNIDTVGMGLESGNQKVLNYLKGNINVEDGYAAIVKLHKYGISANASFIIGSPDETKDQIMDTYRFIKESDLDFFDVYILTPLPGTHLWEYSKSQGKVNDDMDWSRLEVDYKKNKNPVILSKTISREEMDKIYAKFRNHRLLRAARRIYFNPLFTDICRIGMNKILNRCGIAGR